LIFNIYLYSREWKKDRDIQVSDFRFMRHNTTEFDCAIYIYIYIYIYIFTCIC